MSKASPSNQISVVVTVKNDAPGLQALLLALRAQSLLPDQVIITVAHSRDNTRTVANNFKFVNTIDYHVIDVGKSNRSQGRNLGVDQANGEILVFTDAGCLPAKHWLKNLVAPLTAGVTKLVSGYTWGPPTKQLSTFEEAQLPFVLVPLNKIAAHPLPATRNMAIRYRVFKKVGGFNEKLNFAEDYELARRLRSQNIKSVFVPEARVYWQPRHHLISYVKMIWHLTVADIQVGNWRLGHATMWVRYLFFLGWAGVLRIWMAPSAVTLSTVSLLLAYLLFKVSRFDYERPFAYVWAILIQLSTDLTVLAAIGYGLLTRLRVK